MTVCADFVVIGAGAYGTALAITLARVGNKVLLWGRNSAHIDHLKVVRCNQNVLPDVFFPPSLFLESVLPLALSFSRNIIIAVPSYSFNDVLMRLKPYLRCDARIILATKGLEANTGRLLQDVVVDILGSEIPLAVISGPTFAYEMAIGMPTAISISATDPIFVTDLRDLLHCGTHFRVYINSDIIGLQIAGAVKNVIAIGIGISDGIGFGANARTALITRGLAEMSRLGVAMGATLGVFMGLAGVGDLVLTCTDNRSRNRRFGILLGQGVSICDAYRSIGQVVEGFYNTKEVYNLSHKYMVDMPITEQIYYILYKDENVYTAVSALLNRKQKYESYDFLF